GHVARPATRVRSLERAQPERFLRRAGVPAMREWRAVATLTLSLAVLAVAPGQALRVEMLRSIGGLPPYIAGGFSEAVSFQQGPDGTYYVFDRRAHAVFAVNAGRTTVRTIVDIGQEDGRLIQPK